MIQFSGFGAHDPTPSIFATIGNECRLLNTPRLCRFASHGHLERFHPDLPADAGQIAAGTAF
ncbi:hypothetical protein RY831_16635 [Noviherbaspirillum sp. CPCC 100848]|uniref:Uncharacterized protein n=1 Tax=Noviherbaspirillum album TaxID=3080276 RepID=A0ABU6JB86_9BURK|nr:hypothetical protein [Noviherbaspirillum sp. CPCC 100848]MEC4720793.1 hypothetical protein [Noviherbaspirillum sp. CPCC 100848]